MMSAAFCYALFHFLEQINLPEWNGNCFRATLYKKMFERHHLDTLP